MSLAKPLREIVLRSTKREIKEIFGIDAGSTLRYNSDSTQICVDGVELYKHLQDRLSDSAFLEKIAGIRESRRLRILDAHQSQGLIGSEEMLTMQFDYELLGLDHLVDPDRVHLICDDISDPFERNIAKSVLLSPSSGKSFFEEVRIKELEVLGNILRRDSPPCHESFYFEGKDRDYLIKYTSTSKKLIRIVLEHDVVVSELTARYENLRNIYREHSCTKDVYNHIKEMRIEQMRRRAARAAILSKFYGRELRYLRFIGDALDYNEENRLLRSVSFFYIMQDKTLPARFFDLIEARGYAK